MYNIRLWLPCFFSLMILCDGYKMGCETNNTLFVPEGLPTTFDTTVNASSRIWDLAFLNTTVGIEVILHSDIFVADFTEAVRTIVFVSKSTKARMYYYSSTRSLTIVLKHAKSTDNGTYVLRLNNDEVACWTLFVIGIEMGGNTTIIAEGSSAHFLGNPGSSVIEYLTVDVSVSWLLNGVHSSQTDHFLVTGDQMWIPRVTRELDGKIVTYRVKHDDVMNDVNYTLNVIYIETEGQNELVQEGNSVSFHLNRMDLVNNGSESITSTWMLDGRTTNDIYSFRVYEGKMWIPLVTREFNGKNVTCVVRDGDNGITVVNRTLQVTYGPSWPLKFIPSKTAYYLNPGDTLPEIRCEVDCNPLCSISWGDVGSGAVLNIGEVSQDDSAEYVCTVSRQGSDSRLHKSLYLFVQDNSSSTSAFAVLGTILALLNTVAIIVILVCLLIRRYGKSRDAKALKRKCAHVESVDNGVSDLNEHHAEPVQPAMYEALQKDTGTYENELGNYSTLEHENSSNASTKVSSI